MDPCPESTPLFSISPMLSDTLNCNNQHGPSDGGIAVAADPNRATLPPLLALPPTSPMLPGLGVEELQFSIT